MTRRAWSLNESLAKLLYTTGIEARLRERNEAISVIARSTSSSLQHRALLGQATMIMRSADSSVAEENDLRDIRLRFEAAIALLDAPSR